MINLPPTGLNEAALYPWIFWYLWVGRNKLVFESRESNELDVVLMAVKEARIWQAAQREKDKVAQKKSVQVTKDVDTSTDVQCFVDAAWNAGTRCGGFGCIFKDNIDGRFHHTSSSRSNVGSALVAEAIAVKAGLKAARALGLSRLIVRSDSKSLILAISQGEKIVEAQSVLFDISKLCKTFVAVSFEFVPRLNNVDADTLAKAALLSHSV